MVLVKGKIRANEISFPVFPHPKVKFSEKEYGM